MYDRRIKIFVILIAILLSVCLVRLTQMQLLSHSFYSDEIAKLKLRRGRSHQLKTVRGKILDRNGKVLAADEPQFQLCINYTLSSLLDERVQRPDARQEMENKLDDLQQIIEKSARFKGVEPAQMTEKIQKINDFIWSQRTFQAWRSSFPNSEVLQKYDGIMSVPLSQAIVDFEKKQPDPVERLRLVNKVDIAEMYNSWPLLELETDDDIFTAQLEFLDIDDVQVLPKARRAYPYRAVAAQTIGWVGLPQKDDRRLFENDRLFSYLNDEVCGREDGVEYVCETVLRGRRGEEIYDIDRELVNRTETRFGKDVSLTLDIELQQRIEKYLAGYNHAPNSGPGMAVVVIDVAAADVLAMVSMPVFDLNRARYDYAALDQDPNEPLRNRAINKHYPPGSAVKPLILIAGLESGEITPDEIIPCPAKKAPKGWPSCWIFSRYQSGHDYLGRNSVRNAIKWSCNIYFSRLADRIDPLVLQQWLFKFGYGHKTPLAPPMIRETGPNRNLRQQQGQISTGIPKSTVSQFQQIPPLKSNERRYFGIGQGNLRVTPLQVANAFAAIARGGVYKLPRLFMDDPNDSELDAVDLNISPQTLALIRDGMSAVVNEPGGTAYKEFLHSGLDEQGVNVYGKTGSTEQPNNAWFGGFVTDSRGRSISIAVVVEGGQHGSSDAAPLARDTIQFCIEAGYIGQAQPTVQ